MEMQSTQRARLAPDKANVFIFGGIVTGDKVKQDTFPRTVKMSGRIQSNRHISVHPILLQKY